MHALRLLFAGIVILALVGPPSGDVVVAAGDDDGPKWYHSDPKWKELEQDRVFWLQRQTRSPAELAKARATLESRRGNGLWGLSWRIARRLEQIGLYDTGYVAGEVSKASERVSLLEEERLNIDRQLERIRGEQNEIETGPVSGFILGWEDLRIPRGKDMRYEVHCLGRVVTTGADSTVPHRMATGWEDLQRQIASHPNGCVSDATHTRTLRIVPLTRTPDGRVTRGEAIEASRSAP